jgi:fructosamine-3-kinase
MAAQQGCGPLSAVWLARQLGVAATQASAVGGGCIHRAWCLTVSPLAPGEGPSRGARGRIFVKTNQAAALPLLEAEAEGLEALALAAEGTGITVPQPLALGVDRDQAALLLPWQELGGPGAAAGWGALGDGLARLHRRSLGLSCTAGDRPDHFGWPRDNWIGSGPQPNGWEPSWAAFFTTRRLAPQLERLARGGRPLADAARLLERLPAWLAGHQPPPTLVHGDLWSGNAAIAAAGPVLFDPAVYRGDREVDLAMARLFGGFPEAFFAAYERAWPLPEGHRHRVDLYNLYHLLNHANLFGGSYGHQAEAVARRLLAQEGG